MWIKNLFFFLGIQLFLYAGFNEDFDLTTQALNTQFSCLQQKEHKETLSFFAEVRRSLLKDKALEETLKNSSFEDKFMLFRAKEGVVCKKRKRDNINEFFVWELGKLLGGSEFFVPSFPLEIGEKKIIVQPLESFTVGEDLTGVFPDEEVSKVSLESYWKHLLLSYNLGLKDIVGRNIGITSEGKIRLFDIENSFRYKTKQKKTAFDIGFVSHAMDWPHYHQPLDRAMALNLRSFIKSLEKFEHILKIYTNYRPNALSRVGFLSRLDKVKTFYIQEGSTFADFYKHCFPKRNEGVSQLKALISEIIGKEAKEGTAFNFIHSETTMQTVSAEQRKKVKAWVDLYLEPEWKIK